MNLDAFDFASRLDAGISRSNQAQLLKAWVRTAIAFGELSPAAEAHINYIVAQGVSEVDRRLLALLNDAIQAGCMRRIYPSWG